jgi:hypothetical protein
MPNPGEHHPAFEEYCECIFELREDNLDVIQARIADRLRVSRPSVSEMIKRLTEAPHSGHRWPHHPHRFRRRIGPTGGASSSNC